MKKEEAVAVLVKNGWSLQDAKEDVSDWPENDEFPVELSLQIALDLDKAMKPERTYELDKEGHLVDVA